MFWILLHTSVHTSSVSMNTWIKSSKIWRSNKQCKYIIEPVVFTFDLIENLNTSSLAYTRRITVLNYHGAIHVGNFRWPKNSFMRIVFFWCVRTIFDFTGNLFHHHWSLWHPQAHTHTHNPLIHTQITYLEIFRHLRNPWKSLRYIKKSLVLEIPEITL